MLIKSEVINKDKNIMVYMGSYIKDRNEGKYNDVITYDGDSRANYKSYMNLKTGEVLNIGIKKCSEFEKVNFIIKIPVNSNSFDSYLVNYTNLKNWYLKQLEIRSEEEVTEELMKKYGKYIESDKSEEIDKIKKIRDNVRNLEQQISSISEEEKRLYKKLDEIRKNCNHKVIVKTNNVYVDEDGNAFPDEGCCLFCNNWYTDYGFENYIEEIQNSCIIDFTGEQFSELSEEEKVEIALSMFENEREKNPNINDSKIVEKINNELIYDEGYRNCIKNKVLSNKPDSVN